MKNPFKSSDEAEQNPKLSLFKLRELAALRVFKNNMGGLAARRDEAIAKDDDDARRWYEDELDAVWTQAMLEMSDVIDDKSVKEYLLTKSEKYGER